MIHTQKQDTASAVLYPVVREVPADVETPVSVYLKLRRLGPSFLLESVEGGAHLARYSIIGTHPRRVVTAWRDRAVIEAEGEWSEYPLDGQDVLDLVKTIMPAYCGDAVPGLSRFAGGAVGYMGYDLVRSFERLPDLNPDTLGVPEAVFLLCDRLVVYDHVKHQLLVIAHAYRSGSEAESRQEAESAIEEVLARLRRPLPEDAMRPAAPPARPQAGWTSAFSREDFEDAVRRAKEYIAAGDIFQVVLSRRVHRPTHARPFDIYRVLRRVNPSPYMFYMELPDGLRLIGSSPEVLVRVEDGKVETRPLAGTRRRGESAEEDRALEKELLADAKERAEHVMLVDLARNDLGRICRYGSVRTTTMMEVERYSHVMHIVSHVGGELNPSYDAYDVLRACFPAGTVSGAPKVRAMEIIEELEPERRGPYAGAVGYFGFSGNMDTCIAIRTFIMKGREIYLQAGAGIVADSDPACEYEETENKLRALSQALALAEEQMAEKGEEKKKEVSQ